MAAPDIGLGRICLGVITGAHGLDGAVLIRSFTADPASIGAYGALGDAEAKRSFALKVRRVTAKGVVAKIVGIADRTAAEGLKGVELYIGRDALPEPDEDEVYVADVIGLRVEDKDGRSMGTVTSMDNYGAGDVMEVTHDLGGKLLLPFTRAAVPVVDVAAGRVVVDPPAMSEAKGDRSNEGDGDERS
jgi:16S rRNA processing protein RimM